jgi:hypothetical protein
VPLDIGCADEHRFNCGTWERSRALLLSVTVSVTSGILELLLEYEIDDMLLLDGTVLLSELTVSDVEEWTDNTGCCGTAAELDNKD